MGESFFVPYVYVPSAEADYVKLVTPWGNVQLKKGFLEQLAVSVAVVVLTVMLWRCAARLNATLKRKTGAKEAARGPEEEEEEDEEQISALDENMVKKGENSYYYAHQHRKVNDEKTIVSSYGWSDSKKTIR